MENSKHTQFGGVIVNDCNAASSGLCMSTSVSCPSMKNKQTKYIG